MMPAQPHPRAPGCDAPDPAPVYVIGHGVGNSLTGDLTFVCRCVVCGRCGHHTGNSNQGHYWSYCKVTRRREGFHFCCPDDCEFEQERV